MMAMKVTNGYVFIQGMCFHAFHGVLEQERTVGGEYIVDVKVKADFSRAIETDDVSDTIDYSTVYRIVKSEMEVPSALVEHVAGRIAENVFASFPQARETEVKIIKVNPPMGAVCQGAGAVVCFTKDS